ncbi:MAG TPA: DUF262 domain-containing protein, partial [Vicinamibacterales bacterium]|nr:DUF262 domain-containing protein [Vicinamibacterales bacterium]
SSAQTGRPGYSVIDGQQRLRAIFEFLDDRFRLTESSRSAPHYNKKFSELPNALRETIESYDLAIQELTGYEENDIKDIFVRMNKYVVKLSSQELRHAKGEGQFSKFVERIGKWDFWREQRVMSAQQITRMRAVEFVAELTILLIEGPQDKKKAIDLYYGEYKKSFAKASWAEDLLKKYAVWVLKALPDLKSSRYRSPTDLYSLIGALHETSRDGSRLSRLDADAAGERLRDFAAATKVRNPTGDAARYLAAASSPW